MLDPTFGPARDRLDNDEQAKLRTSRALVTDHRRSRPLYFDGRFLAARDLTREQTYFLSRLADLGRAGGSGVVHGLHVTRGGAATSIMVSAGHGVTPQGEIVVLTDDLPIDLVDVPEIQRLDAAFGLIQIPREPARQRTGLYIVALRPVEYTANPIASYPTSVNGTRSVEDGDIIEGVVVTLIPYADWGARDEIDRRRARVSRRLFVENGSTGIPAGALPLAMLALDRGVVQWIDEFMVRREVGSEHSDVLGLGFAPRALREAHLLQYQRHLSDELQRRSSTGLGQRITASELFDALPPAGPIPSASINSHDFTQIFFPAQVDVELSIIPEDELMVLLEDSLLLPPIDLTLGPEEMESTSVLVVIPVPRHQLRLLSTTLGSLTRIISSAAPGLVALRTPLETLRGLRWIRPVSPTPADLVVEEWRRLLASTEELWYMRRRNLQYKADVVGVGVPVVGDDLVDEDNFNTGIEGMGLTARLNDVTGVTTISARRELVALLGSPKVSASRLLTEAALEEVEKEGEEATNNRVGLVSVVKAADKFADPKFGEGMTRLMALWPALNNDERVMGIVARSRIVPELDRLARYMDDKTLKALIEELQSLVTAGDPVAIAAFVRDAAERLKDRPSGPLRTP